MANPEKKAGSAAHSRRNLPQMIHLEGCLQT
jgi:hypothetical protein